MSIGIGYTENFGWDASASHNWILFVKDSPADPNVDSEFNGTPSESGGIIGTSEWAWAKEEDLRLIATSLEDNPHVTPEQFLD